MFTARPECILLGIDNPLGGPGGSGRFCVESLQNLTRKQQPQPNIQLPYRPGRKTLRNPIVLMMLAGKKLPNPPKCGASKTRPQQLLFLTSQVLTLFRLLRPSNTSRKVSGVGSQVCQRTPTNTFSLTSRCWTSLLFNKEFHQNPVFSKVIKMRHNSHPERICAPP